MFDIGWQELFLIGVVALVVIGPKDLPKALRTGARVLTKARAMSREFQAGLAELAREAELDDLKRSVEKSATFDPSEELKRAVDPTGRFTEDFDPTEFNRKLKAAVEGGSPGRPATPPAGVTASFPEGSPAESAPPPSPGVEHATPPADTQPSAAGPADLVSPRPAPDAPAPAPRGQG